jgi:hypothetical protein
MVDGMNSIFQKLFLWLKAESKPTSKIKCPCCGYPTLDEKSAHEICSLCNWEDDGQGDEDADLVTGGPNYEYSLSEARNNFKKYLIMYDPKKHATRIGGNSNTPIEQEAKSKIIEAYREFEKNGNGNVKLLKKQIQANEEILRAEMYRKIREYENKGKSTRP